MLLEREEVDPDKPNNYGDTLFSNATWFEQERVVKILLGLEEAYLNRPDLY